MQLNFIHSKNTSRPSFISYPVVFHFFTNDDMEPIKVQWTRTICFSWPQQSLRGVTGAWLNIVLLPLPFNTVSAARNTFNFDPQALHCYQLTSWSEWPRARPPEDRGLCGLGGDFGKGEAPWLSIHIYIYTSVCQLKCASKKIIKRIMRVLEVLCVQLCPKGSNSVLSLQADILIITSLVKWKCEPRKQESAKKDFPFISWLAGLLVVCSAAGLWSARGGTGGWTQCPWLSWVYPIN